MGDSSDSETDKEDRCNLLLRGESLRLNDEDDSIPWILNHIDYFVSQSRGNETIQRVCLPPDVLLVSQDIELWDKLGQALGNLQALERFHLDAYDYDGNDEKDLPIPHWEILTRILSHVRQRIILTDAVSAWRAENARSFARAISGHPTITCFESDTMFPYEASDALYSALATLPALESITLSNRQLNGRPEDESALTNPESLMALLRTLSNRQLNARPEDESALANPESLTELLRVPSLRSVDFHTFHFTRALCHAAANALMEGTAVTKLEFSECSFSAEECAAIMAKGLTRNTSVVSILVAEPLDGVIIGALTAALPSNSTLRELSVSSSTHRRISISAAHLSSLFLALGNNRGLKILFQWTSHCA
jgi:hypothetical protein